MAITYSNIWSADPYIFKSTASGVDVHSYATSDLLGYLDYSAGINSVWADVTYLYLATTNSGIYRSTLSGILINPLTLYKAYPDITHDEVYYIHGSGNYLGVTTFSGVDRLNLTTGANIYTDLAAAGKCYQTSAGAFYYTTPSGLEAVYDVSTSYHYSDIIEGDVNDIYVTEGTSQYVGENVLFLATTVGAVMIEERRGNEENGRFKYFMLDETLTI